MSINKNVLSITFLVSELNTVHKAARRIFIYTRYTAHDSFDPAGVCTHAVRIQSFDEFFLYTSKSGIVQAHTGACSYYLTWRRGFSVLDTFICLRCHSTQST